MAEVTVPVVGASLEEPSTGEATAPQASSSLEEASLADAATPPPGVLTEDVSMTDAATPPAGPSMEESSMADAAPEPGASIEESSAAAATTPPAGPSMEASSVAEAAAPPAGSSVEESSRLDAAPQAGSSIEESSTVGTAAPPVESTEESSTADATTPKSSPKAKVGTGLKRKRASVKGAMSLEAMASNVRQLQQEAVELEAAALAKRSEAHKAEQEYMRRQSEEALANLEKNGHKSPPNPFMLFKTDMRSEMTGLSFGEGIKKVGEMWRALSDEKKKEYKDKSDAQRSKFNEWSKSDEGQKMLAARSEALKQAKASGKEQLAGAAGEAAEETPAKRQAKAKASLQVATTPPKESKRAAHTSPVTLSIKVATPTKPVVTGSLRLDETVVAEAEKAKLLVQLRNLADRPDVRALGKSGEELWVALKANGGMVNSAKRALLGSQ